MSVTSGNMKCVSPWYRELHIDPGKVHHRWGHPRPGGKFPLAARAVSHFFCHISTFSYSLLFLVSSHWFAFSFSIPISFPSTLLLLLYPSSHCFFPSLFLYSRQFLSLHLPYYVLSLSLSPFHCFCLRSRSHLLCLFITFSPSLSSSLCLSCIYISFSLIGLDVVVIVPVPSWFVTDRALCCPETRPFLIPFCTIQSL